MFSRRTATQTVATKRFVLAYSTDEGKKVKATTVEEFDSMTWACVAFGEYVDSLILERTTGRTVYLSDTVRKTIVKVRKV